MTTGAPLYLVSACGSAEEFVAAFRRYADRTGLFVPSASPLPAGRRGRLAITLKDGGVMIEGEAEILQSSARPTVLHGRPGMTVKFVEPDEPSKAVIGELEKARLAIKPAPPSVAPRPADIPATPRPVVPAPSGRIDAANALAECVVIGDPSTLKETATTPRAFGDNRFVVPAIPAIGAPRPKSSSALPAIPAKPAPSADRPKTPTAPPDPAATPLPPPAVSSRMTSIGFPALKLPAKPASASVAPATTQESGATSPAATAPSSGPVAAPPAAPGSEPIAAPEAAAPAPPGSGPVAAPTAAAPAPPGSGPVVAAPAPAPGSGPVSGTRRVGSGPVSNATTLGMPALDRKPERPALDTKPGIDVPTNPTVPSMPAQGSLLETLHGHRPARADATPPRLSAPAAQPQSPDAKSADARPVIAKSKLEPIIDDEATAFAEMPPAPVPAATEANPRRTDSSKHKATSIGFPVIRSTFATQPLGLVPPASPNRLDLPSEPAPPTLPKSARAPQGPRGKNPTTPPLTPRHPTPVAPVPIVRSPAKAAPVVADEERTDLSEVPTAVAAPIEAEAASDSGATETPAPAQRSGGMRASEILAAIPAGDWTMSPDESVPHALAPEERVTAPPPEPTPPPAPPPKGPPTGNWTISLDPETGWSEPMKVETPAAPATAAPASRPASPASGNPIHAVASEKPIEVQQWEEKPTSIGESKIEIDATLMEPLAAMPPDEDVGAPDAPRNAPSTAPPPPMPPMPPGPNAFASPAPAGSAYDIAATPGYPVQGSSAAMAPATARSKRNKMIALAVGAAAVAIAAIVILVMTLGGQKQAAQGSVTEIVAPQAADAGAAGSAQPAAVPAGSADESASGRDTAGTDTDDGDGDEGDTDSAADDTEQAVEPALATGGACKVTVKSIPAGADVLLGKQKLGKAPGTFELPCGSAAKLTLRKRSYATTVRTFTPEAGAANQLVVRLGKGSVSVKVTSTPAGATITAGGRSMGVTPTTIRLPASGTSTIRLTKPGYAPETRRLTPRQKKGSIHVTLKRGRGR